MGYAEPDLPEAEDGPLRPDDGSPATGPLPDAAERSLDEIAVALDVTTAILSRGLGTSAGGTGRVSLLEASALLQAFIRIGDPGIRRRCMAFVEEVAAQAKASPGAR